MLMVVGKRWTTVHGHFLQMGGFRLQSTACENMFTKESTVLRLRDKELIPETFLCRPVDGAGLISKILVQIKQIEGVPRGDVWSGELSEANAMQTDFGDDIWEGVLSYSVFKDLLSENLICFPDITENEINDRSKGDALSKSIAFLQLTWFIIQIIARAAQGLDITELELTTAALAGLNSVMYIFWWSKPCDVRFPVVLRTKGAEQLLAKTSKATTWKYPDSEPDFDFRVHIWTAFITPILAVLDTLSRLIKAQKPYRYGGRNAGPNNSNEGEELIGTVISDDAQAASGVFTDGDNSHLEVGINSAFLHRNYLLTFRLCS